MLKFPPQEGVEIYSSQSGLICFSQHSHELGKEVTVCITIGQFRSLLKNADDLIDQANHNKKHWTEQEAHNG